MLASEIPAGIPLPFAASGTKNAIPIPSQIGITPGAASLTDGFPPLTMTPVAAGGVPPSGADFNGIFNMITAVQQWQSAGGVFKYDSDFSTAIGGYPAGAVLMSTDNKTKWLNLADNNTTDPDGGGAANWITMSGGRLLKTSIYINDAGTLKVSINGGAFASSSSTFTALSLTSFVDVEVNGSGGAGGGGEVPGAGNVSAGSGGGAGGYARKIITSGFSGVTVTVGAGGAGVTGATGNSGSSSSFGALISATGGAGGTLGSIVAPSNQPVGWSAGGTGTGGTINAEGGAGQFAIYSNPPVSGSGGNSMFGQGARRVFSTQGGFDAVSYGSGGSGGSLGSGAVADAAGGAGASGIVIVREYS